MRSTAVLIAAAALAIPAGLAAEAAPPRCEHRAKSTVAENRYLVAWKRRNRYGDIAYVCDKRSGRREYLAYSDGIDIDFLCDFIGRRRRRKPIAKDIAGPVEHSK